jgi:hypothetical protein
MEQRRTHSLLGMASVAIFAVNTAGVVLALVVLLSTTHRAGYAERFNAYLPLGACAAPIVYLVGLALAILGLRDKSGHRLFPVLGIVLNGLALPAEIAANALWILLNV